MAAHRYTEEEIPRAEPKAPKADPAAAVKAHREAKQAADAKRRSAVAFRDLLHAQPAGASEADVSKALKAFAEGLQEAWGEWKKGKGA